MKMLYRLIRGRRRRVWFGDDQSLSLLFQVRIMNGLPLDVDTSSRYSEVAIPIIDTREKVDVCGRQRAVRRFAMLDTRRECVQWLRGGRRKRLGLDKRRRSLEKWFKVPNPDQTGVGRYGGVCAYRAEGNVVYVVVDKGVVGGCERKVNCECSLEVVPSTL